MALREVCHFHDDATPLSFQLQVTEDFFKISKFCHNGKMTSFRGILGQSIFTFLCLSYVSFEKLLHREKNCRFRIQDWM